LEMPHSQVVRGFGAAGVILDEVGAFDRQHNMRFATEATS
jgi:hypothetical protein